MIAQKNLRSLSSAAVKSKKLTSVVDYMGKNRDPRVNLEVTRLENRIRSIDANSSQE